MNKTIKSLTEKADKILAASDAQLKDIIGRIEKERAVALEQKKAMDAAMAAADPVAFRTSKAAYTEASENIGMYETRCETLESGPLVSEAEYAEAVNAIMDALKAEYDHASEQIFALVDEIDEISNRLQTTINEGNVALHKWQVDVYREDLGMWSPATGIRLKEKKWRDDALLDFAGCVTRQAVYRKYKGLPVNYNFG